MRDFPQEILVNEMDRDLGKEILAQWKTPCAVSIPILFIALKLNISFILHVFEI